MISIYNFRNIELRNSGYLTYYSHLKLAMTILVYMYICLCVCDYKQYYFAWLELWHRLDVYVFINSLSN